MEIEPENASPQSRRRRKSTKSTRTAPTFHSKGGDTQLRPNIDVILSLKDPVYKAVMMGYFQHLGGKSNSKKNEEEKEVAREVLELFKHRKRGERTRFFKPESRYSPTGAYVEVDESAAMEKITADIYRRMESANRWMVDASAGDVAQNNLQQPRNPRGNPHLSTLPSFDRETGKMIPAPAVSAAAFNIPVQKEKASSPAPATKLPPLKSAKNNNKKRKVLIKKVPQSLPFLTNTDVADIIVEEELRAKKIAEEGLAGQSSPRDDVWQPNDVTNFFRGLYVHGWGEWNKISLVVKTRSNQEIKSYAMNLGKKWPQMRKFFNSKQVQKMQEKHGVKVKRYGSEAAKSSGSGSRGSTTNLVVAQQNHDALLAAVVMEKMKHQPPKKKPKVVICLGDYIIDTEADPSLIQLSNERKRPADTLPDYFDPAVRPSVPTNRQQIYIPGNKVYARWLNKDDPGSYGTWYPGFIHGSKVAPIQDEYNHTGLPSLVYHVKFDDGAESVDLDTEDIMIQEQYQAWLKDLEQYYSLPVNKEMIWKRLTKNTRVYAKWIDPTDPELHGSWMSGKVHSSKLREGNSSQGRHIYHIYFDNGDQDADLQDGDVIEEEFYKQLLTEKMERGRKKSRLSGFELITEASKISSPIKTGPGRSDAAISSSAKKRLYSEVSATRKKSQIENSNNSNDSALKGVRCTEKLGPNSPSPTRAANFSGIYTKSKPGKDKAPLDEDSSIITPPNSSTCATSNGLLSGTKNNSVPVDQASGIKSLSPGGEGSLNKASRTNETKDRFPQHPSTPSQPQECGMNCNNLDNNAKRKHADKESKASPNSQGIDPKSKPPSRTSSGDSQKLVVETINVMTSGAPKSISHIKTGGLGTGVAAMISSKQSGTDGKST